MSSEQSAREERVYANAGNAPLIGLLADRVGDVLDVGCGAGDNTRLVKRHFPRAVVTGITISSGEAERARNELDEVLVCDLEAGFPAALRTRRFDTIIFSHVLEHLRNPALIVSDAVSLLTPGGQMLIAVPNVLGWRQRIKFLLGDFTYEAAGVLDNTHLRFFTYVTADRLLVSEHTPLRVTHKGVTGGVPLWILRRHLLPKSISVRIDKLACALFPNLFGDQIILRLTRNG